MEPEAFEAVSAAVGKGWPGTAVVPYLLMAATDSRHFHAWCEHVYRFAPLLMDDDQRARIHGEDEWASVESLERGERFHRALIAARGGEFAAGHDDGTRLGGDAGGQQQLEHVTRMLFFLGLGVLGDTVFRNAHMFRAARKAQAVSAARPSRR